MRTIRFKNPAGTVTVGGQTFHPGNMTPQIYDELVKHYPGVAEHFEVDEEKEKPAEKPAKAEKPSTETKG